MLIKKRWRNRETKVYRDRRRLRGIETVGEETELGKGRQQEIRAWDYCLQ